MQALCAEAADAPPHWPAWVSELRVSEKPILQKHEQEEEEEEERPRNKPVIYLQLPHAGTFMSSYAQTHQTMYIYHMHTYTLPRCVKALAFAE